MVPSSLAMVPAIHSAGWDIGIFNKGGERVQTANGICGKPANGASRHPAKGESRQPARYICEKPAKCEREQPATGRCEKPAKCECLQPAKRERVQPAKCESKPTYGRKLARHLRGADSAIEQGCSQPNP